MRRGRAAADTQPPAKLVNLDRDKNVRPSKMRANCNAHVYTYTSISTRTCTCTYCRTQPPTYIYA